MKMQNRLIAVTLTLGLVACNASKNSGEISAGGSAKLSSSNTDSGALCDWAKGEATRLQALLVDQEQQIGYMEPQVSMWDLARLDLIKQVVQSIEKNINDNMTAGKASITPHTLALIQQLIIRYRYSKAFLGWTDGNEEPSYSSIYTEDMAPNLKRLRDDYNEMARLFELDEGNPDFGITSSTFSTMKQLVDQMQNIPMSDAVRAALQKTIPFIGQAQAAANAYGDRPCTFAKSIPAVQKISELYPDLDQVEESSAAAPLVASLIALNEYYSEYAQASRVSNPGTCDVVK